MTEETTSAMEGPASAPAALLNITKVVYALQGIGVVMSGLLVFKFHLFGILMNPLLVIAVIINYVKRDDVRDTFLASHFRWQIRTFWFGMLWAVIGVFTALFLIGFLILFVDALWMAYRVIKGWLDLIEGKPMYRHRAPIGPAASV